MYLSTDYTFYCSSTKLWECNVFTGVCLSICSMGGGGGVGNMNGSWDRSHTRVPP